MQSQNPYPDPLDGKNGLDQPAFCIRSPEILEILEGPLS